MPRRALFSSPIDQSARLAYLQEFFTWLYGADRSPEQTALRFWSWWVGLTPLQMARHAQTDWRGMLSETKMWNWEVIRERLRVDLEARLNHVREPRAPVLNPAPSQLRTWPSKDGREFFALLMMLPDPLNESTFPALVLEELLRHLEGLSVEAIGRCEVCEHLFLRRRAGVRQYCSARCRNQAAVERAAAAARQKSRARQRKTRRAK